MSVIKVEIFSIPACTKCTQAREYLHQLLDEYGTSVLQVTELNVLEHLDYAVQIGVLTTPAIVIDGHLYFTGLPSVKKLRSTLNKLLEKP